jgi:hypothetical protein
MLGKSFSLVRFLLNIVLSPLLIWGLGYYYFQDIRSASLLSLYIVTGYNIFFLILKFLMILLSALTFNIFGILKKSIEIILAIIFVAIYWTVYIVVWGPIFEFVAV